MNNEIDRLGAQKLFRNVIFISDEINLRIDRL
jgi:hypothetical protein